MDILIFFCYLEGFGFRVLEKGFCVLRGGFSGNVEVRFEEGFRILEGKNRVFFRLGRLGRFNVFYKKISEGGWGVLGNDMGRGIVVRKS